MVHLCTVVQMLPMVTMLADNQPRIGLHRSRAEHGSGHRTPDGEQDGQQDQDEGTQVLHDGRLSGRRAVHAGWQKFHP